MPTNTLKQRVTKQPRIITLTHEFFPQKGGIATYCREVMCHAHQSGLDVEVWAPKHAALENNPFPYPVRQLPLRGTQGWPCRIKLAKYLRKYRELWEGSVLYMPEPGPLRTFLYSSQTHLDKLAGLVLTLHGSEIARLNANAMRRRLFRRILEHADVIGVVSEYSRRLLDKYQPDLGDRVKVLHGALRSDIMYPESDPFIRTKRDDGRAILLTVARVHPRKGQMAVLEAMTKMPASVRDKTEYWLAGPTNHKTYRRELMRFAQRHRLRLKLLGEVEDHRLNELYHQADIFVMASQRWKSSVEGFGLSYLEASAHGLPVVAHRTGGVTEAIKEGHNGLLVPVGDRSALCMALTQLIENPQARLRLARNGPDWSRQFNWGYVVDELFEPFREAQPVLSAV